MLTFCKFLTRLNMRCIIKYIYLVQTKLTAIIAKTKKT